MENTEKVIVKKETFDRMVNIIKANCVGYTFMDMLTFLSEIQTSSEVYTQEMDMKNGN